MTDEELRAEAKRQIDETPDWAVAVWLRYGLRVVNGVPIEKAEALYWREIAIARAQQSQGGAQ